MKTFVTLLAVLCGVGLAFSGGVDNPVLDTTHTNYIAGDTEIVVTGGARSGSNVLSIGSAITRDAELAAYIPYTGANLPVVIDDTNVRTNTYGGYVSALGERIQGGTGASVAGSSLGSIAIGRNATASGASGATAFGRDTLASGASGATALGEGTIASGTYGAIAAGEACTASGNYGAMALGYNSVASGNAGAVALGRNVTASGGDGAVALGKYSVVSNDSALAWSGQGGAGTEYGSKGTGTFAIDPVGGLAGTYVGATPLSTTLAGYLPLTGGSGYTVVNAVTNNLALEWWTASNRWAYVERYGSTTNVTFITPAR